MLSDVIAFGVPVNREAGVGERGLPGQTVPPEAVGEYPKRGLLITFQCLDEVSFRVPVCFYGRAVIAFAGRSVSSRSSGGKWKSEEGIVCCLGSNLSFPGYPNGRRCLPSALGQGPPAWSRGGRVSPSGNALYRRHLHYSSLCDSKTFLDGVMGRCVKKIGLI